MQIVSLVISAFAFIVSGIVAFIQWKNRDESRRTRDINVMLRIFETMDSDEFRADRAYIYALGRDNDDWKDIPQLINRIGESRVKQVERVISKFDSIGYFILYGFSHKQEIPQWIFEITSEMWKRLNPLIMYFRKLEGRQNGYALYFERLYWFSTKVKASQMRYSER